MPKPTVGSSKAELIRLAIAGIEAQIRELEEKRSQLAKLASGAAPTGGRPGRKRATIKASTAKPAKKKRVVTAATRRKLKEAAKARWARIRAEKG